MPRLSDHDVVVLDCYGTMVDWETGILTALQPLVDGHRFSRQHLLAIFHECEAAQQSRTPDLAYTQLLEAVHPQVAARLGLPTPSRREDEAFGASVGQWPAFPDSVDALRRLARHFKLVVLSNVDRDSLASTCAGPFGSSVAFDLVITAQDVGSYKPDLANFEHMLARVGEEFGVVDKDRVLQTAQSQFHDHHPARRMGIRSVWIARPGALMGNSPDEVYDWKFDTLAQMADAVDAELANEMDGVGER